jgi:diguanylate cyclase (GGDEF)-like protein/PAS domain S-box-containing protein
MTRKDNPAAELRQQAETLLRESATPSPEAEAALSPEAIRQTLHDLQVHQIELEMQNEELRQTHVELDTVRAHYFDLFDLAPVGYCTLSESGLILEANLTAVNLLGMTRSALIRQRITRFILKEDQGIYYRHRQQLFATGAPQICELRLVKRDGAVFWARLQATAVPDEDNGPVCRVVIIDITERKATEEKLHLAACVFSYAREGILITTADGTIIEANAAFSQITGYPRDEVLGQNPRLLSSGRHNQKFFATLWHDVIENGHWHGEIWNRRKNGEVYAELLTISAVRDADGHIQQYVGLFSDITVLKEHQQQLEHIAHYDLLTTLPNRVLLADRLHQAMAQAHRRGQQIAVALLDLDGFKVVNDHHGRAVGDRLLIALAAGMKQALREGDTLARMGGDEFVAVLIDLADIEASVPILTRLLAAAAQPVALDDLVLQVSASIGVTFYPQADDVDADQLLRQADQAMYQAKQASKNRYHIFDAAQDRNLRAFHETLDRIRRALAEHEFVLYYQPKVNMRIGTVIGVEALIRWQHPEKGLLPPAVFLPVIENHPLAVEIGEWVIETALTQIETWQAIGFTLPISVNVGARQLQQANFVERLQARLAAHPAVSPSSLELEVLETSALEDLTHVSQVIAACRQIGVQFALDDFGTGYSSLTYLKRLAVAQLKIDQSFVRDMLEDPEDLAILEGVLGLATAFRRQVIAEGVETVGHGEMLLQFGCELAQGYGIARPMPAAGIPDWLATWHPDPSWMDRPAVSRDDLPILFAGVEHRAWMMVVEAFIMGTRDTLPRDDLPCRFSVWLAAEGLAGRGTQPTLPMIAALHQQIHVRVAELLELQAQGRNPEALAGLGELHILRDRLLERLAGLLSDRQA